MDPITATQARYLAYALKEAGVEYKPGMLQAIDSLDKMTASGIIKFFKNEQPELAVAQLSHLFPNEFYNL